MKKWSRNFVLFLTSGLNGGELQVSHAGCSTLGKIFFTHCIKGSVTCRDDLDLWKNVLPLPRTDLRFHCLSTGSLVTPTLSRLLVMLYWEIRTCPVLHLPHFLR
jgi:hypothetical protein